MAYVDITQQADATDTDGQPSASVWTAVDQNSSAQVSMYLPLGATLADATARFNGVADVQAPPREKQLVNTGRAVVLSEIADDGALVDPLPVVEADDLGGISVVLVSPGGARWRLSVTDTGALNTTEA